MGQLSSWSSNMGSGKPRGIKAARKLRIDRRENRWANKAWKKAHLGTAIKCSPFGGSSHAKGIVLEKIGIEAKQPNSAIRKCVRAQLIKNGKKIAAFVPNDGCLNFVEENDEVLIAGFGRKGHAVGDIPGVRFKVVKVSGVAVLDRSDLGRGTVWGFRVDGDRAVRARRESLFLRMRGLDLMVSPQGPHTPSAA